MVLFSLASRYNKISVLDTHEHECTGRKKMDSRCQKIAISNAVDEGAKKKRKQTGSLTDLSSRKCDGLG